MRHLFIQKLWQKKIPLDLAVELKKTHLEVHWPQLTSLNFEAHRLICFTDMFFFYLQTEIETETETTDVHLCSPNNNNNVVNLKKNISLNNNNSNSISSNHSDQSNDGMEMDCEGCGESVRDRVILRVGGRSWHSGCLKCCTCARPLHDQRSCFIKGMRLYCRYDYGL